MEEIKAITTVYNNYKFRSRLEARWGVFYGAMGVEYEYEKEGFELPSGWYLPDFWLPLQKYWIEIKDHYPTEYERSLGYELCMFSKKSVYIFYNNIDPANNNFAYPFLYKDDLADYDDSFYEWCQCPICNKLEIHFMGYADRISCKCQTSKIGLSDKLELAYAKARQAQFEYGVKG